MKIVNLNKTKLMFFGLKKVIKFILNKVHFERRKNIFRIKIHLHTLYVGNLAIKSKL